jgi:uncharacterized repeat protein (TIGR01451 family)
MKKIYVLFALFFLVFHTHSTAQVFSSGDITVSQVPIATHDSEACMSQGQMMYNITIMNSFVGDSVKVKDMFSGYVVFEDVNTSGANPWIMTAPIANAFGIVPDDQLNSGMAFFSGPINKVISGPDTVFNVTNFYSLPVPDPCLYATVSGTIYVDNNNDCSFNGTDIPLNAIGVSIAENLSSPAMSAIGYGTNSNGAGNYYVNILQSWMTSYTVSIPSYYQFIFPSVSCSPAFYSFTTLPQTNADFSLQCTSNVDLQCGAGSPGNVHPNVPFYLHPYVSNTGCDTISGTLKLILDPNVVYSAGLSTNPANTVSGDTLIWNFSTLSNLSNGAYWNSFFSQIHLTPSATVTVGDTLCFRIFTNVPSNDLDASNNDYSFCIPVVNSYDPNFKEVNPKGTGIQGNIPVSTDELNYTIHFQNTGTAAASNVSIIDTLDAHIDATSLSISGTSHYVIPEWIAPGIVKFNFTNINLADSGSNELASHGFISFNVKLNPSLPAGTVIQNTAGIYFDFNPAIITNTTTNTLTNPSGINNLSDMEALTIYPNPFASETIVHFKTEQKNTSIIIMDLLGKEIKSYLLNDAKDIAIEKEQMNDGIYILRITDANKNVMNQKIIVE